VKSSKYLSSNHFKIIIAKGVLVEGIFVTLSSVKRNENKTVSDKLFLTLF
jgi:hypothetical protein